MKKRLFTVLIFSLAFISAPVIAGTVDVISDNSVIVEEVYIHNSTGYTGSPTSSGATAVNVVEPKPYPTGYPADNDATPSHWDNGTGNWFGINAPAGTDWIWDTPYASSPRPEDGGYVATTDRAKWGHAVLLKIDFSVPGIPVSANIHITADNCYSCWLEGGTRVNSVTAYGTGGWETSLMLQAQVNKDGWQTVGHHSLNGLASGDNTLYVLAGNENYTDNPVPSSYWKYNPGGAIFWLEVEYEEIVLVPNVAIKKYVSVDGDPWEDADVAPGPTAMVGDPIDWKYVVTNTGEVSLTGVVVTDDQGVTPVYDEGDTNMNGELDLTETWIYYASGTAVAGPYTNIGTVDTDEEVTASDPAHYTGQAPGQSRWTGGGTIGSGAIIPRGVRVTHGFEFHNDLDKPNNLEVNWGGNRFHMTELLSAFCWMNPDLPLPNPPKAPANEVFATGVGRYNGVDGYLIDFHFTDVGEPGKNNDWADIVITAPDETTVVLEVEGYLSKGNHQAHPDNK